MMINSATDHGFNHDPAIVVRAGLIARANSACGIYTYEVRRRHRDHGYWETVITEGGHPALLNSIQVRSEQSILADAYAA